MSWKSGGVSVFCIHKYKADINDDLKINIDTEDIVVDELWMNTKADNGI